MLDDDVAVRSSTDRTLDARGAIWYTRSAGWGLPRLPVGSGLACHSAGLFSFASWKSPAGLAKRRTVLVKISALQAQLAELDEQAKRP